MSTIPNSAMPHAYVHVEDEGRRPEQAKASSGVLIGGAIAAYLLYRFLR